MMSNRCPVRCSPRSGAGCTCQRRAIEQDQHVFGRGRAEAAYVDLGARRLVAVEVAAEDAGLERKQLRKCLGWSATNLFRGDDRDACWQASDVIKPGGGDDDGVFGGGGKGRRYTSGGRRPP